MRRACLAPPARAGLPERPVLDLEADAAGTGAGAAPCAWPEKNWPNRSERSQTCGPPAPPAAGPRRYRPLLIASRTSSYCARFFSSPRTSYADETSLKRVSFFLSPPVESGWNSLASFRYAFLISDDDAFGSTPSTL